MNAIEFVSEIAKASKRLDRHPIITINWNTFKLSLRSFGVDAVTKRDITLAKETDDLVNIKKINNKK